MGSKRISGKLPPAPRRIVEGSPAPGTVVPGPVDPETSSTFPDPRHQELFEYWNSKRGDRIAPTRKDIDPIDLPKLLPYMFIFQVQDNPRNYRLSLLGTQLVAVLGRDFTGATFDEMYSDDGASTLRMEYDWVADRAEPYYDELDARWMSKDYIAYRRLLLPLSDDGARVDRLLGCAFFIKEDD